MSIRKLRPQMPSRRMFLRGAATTLALPFLHSALPRRAWGVDYVAPPRAVFYFAPNGLQMPDFVPKIAGTGYDLPPIIAPVAALQHKISVLTGLKMDAADSFGVGDHARGTAAFLTCSVIKQTDGADIENGISVDQLLAQSFGGDTVFPSLQVGLTDGNSTGDCNAGYSCAYSRNISWVSATQPLPNVTEPAVLFDRMFGGGAELTPEQAAHRMMLRQSVLDNVTSDANQLMGKLGAADKAKLEQYLTSVRELEVRISSVGGGACESGTRPAEGLAFPERVAAFNELMALALECDLTRIVTFMMGSGASNQSFDHVGVPSSHHQTSHHGHDLTNLTNLTIIEAWEVEQFVALAQRLDGIADGGGTLLDHSMLYFGSEISDGDSHSHYHLGALLAGGASLGMTTGEHLQYAPPGAPEGEQEPMANVFIAMMQGFGMRPATFGADGTEPAVGLFTDPGTTAG